MSQIDVSQLAECSATGLLAAQVRVCLKRYASTHSLSPMQRDQVQRIQRYLADALEGLDGLRKSRKDIGLAPDRLDAILTFRTASEAWQRQRAVTLDEDNLNELEQQLKAASDHLMKALSGNELDSKEVQITDQLLSSLSGYCVAQGRDIVRSSIDLGP